MLGPELYRCALCDALVASQRVLNIDAMTRDDDSGPAQQVVKTRYHSVCGGELHPESGDDLLMAEVRELAQSGNEVVIYERDSHEFWALAGTAGDRTSPTWAACTRKAGAAAREARLHMGRALQLQVPDVDVSAFTDRGLTPQWGILEGSGIVALRVWRGGEPAFDAIATGTSHECVERALRRLALDT